MIRQRRALEEIAARKRGREDEHGVVILESDEDGDAPGPSNPPCQPGEGCSRDEAAEEATTMTTTAAAAAATTRSSTGSSACRASREAGGKERRG